MKRLNKNKCCLIIEDVLETFYECKNFLVHIKYLTTSAFCCIYMNRRTRNNEWPVTQPRPYRIFFLLPLATLSYLNLIQLLNGFVILWLP